MTRVLVVDDHALFRAGVRAELEGRVELVGDAATVDDAVAAIAELRPDVVLLDVHMPDGGGVEVLRHIARGYLYKEIALRLGISVKTVEAHVSAVLRKLQLSTRHQLSRWAAERRLLE